MACISSDGELGGYSSYTTQSLASSALIAEVTPVLSVTLKSFVLFSVVVLVDAGSAGRHMEAVPSDTHTPFDWRTLMDWYR